MPQIVLLDPGQGEEKVVTPDDTLSGQSVQIRNLLVQFQNIIINIHQVKPQQNKNQEGLLPIQMFDLPQLFFVHRNSNDCYHIVVFMYRMQLTEHIIIRLNSVSSLYVFYNVTVECDLNYRLLFIQKILLMVVTYICMYIHEIYESTNQNIYLGIEKPN